MDEATPIAEAGSRPDTSHGQGFARPVATVLVVLALFASAVVDGLYRGLEREPPDALPFLLQVFLVLSVISWFFLYSQRQRIPWVLDMGWFLFAAWVILVPYYILKREGRAGWSRIGLFCLTWFAAWCSGWAVSIWTSILLAG